MNSFDAVRRTLVALESLSVKYVLVGALATNVYSIPRSTKDADIVVVFEAGELRRLRNALGSCMGRLRCCGNFAPKFPA